MVAKGILENRIETIWRKYIAVCNSQKKLTKLTKLAFVAYKQHE